MQMKEQTVDMEQSQDALSTTQAATQAMESSLKILEEKSYQTAICTSQKSNCNPLMAMS